MSTKPVPFEKPRSYKSVNSSEVMENVNVEKLCHDNLSSRGILDECVAECRRDEEQTISSVHRAGGVE